MRPEPATGPPERLTWVGHSTVLLELDGRRFLTDPVLRGRIGPLVSAIGPADPGVASELDAVLVSHMHYDHLDAPSLRRIARSTPVIAPRGTAPTLRRLGFEDVTELAAGETKDIGGVPVRAVPARHEGRRRPLGARAETLGFVIGAPRPVYFAGDTGLFDGMEELGNRDRLDVALLPVAGWGPTLGSGHLGPREAAAALSRLRPRIAVPIHWGTLHLLGLGSRRRGEPAGRFVELAAELAPSVDVHVLEPGEALTLGDPGETQGHPQ